jgi:hypothetical protein
MRVPASALIKMVFLLPQKLVSEKGWYYYSFPASSNIKRILRILI